MMHIGEDKLQANNVLNLTYGGRTLLRFEIREVSRPGEKMAPYSLALRKGPEDFLPLVGYFKRISYKSELTFPHMF